MNIQIQKEKRPLGINVILFVMAIFLLITPFEPHKSTVIGPYIVRDYAYWFYAGIFEVLLGISFYGILKRYKWAYWFTIAFNIFCFIFVWVNYGSFFYNQTEIATYMYSLSPNNTAFINEITTAKAFLTNSLAGSIFPVTAVMYLYKKKNYFNNQNVYAYTQGQSGKRPLGISIFLILTVLTMLCLPFSLNTPKILGPYIVEGVVVWLYEACQALVIGVMCYGIWKRRMWGAQLAMICSLFGMGMIWFNYISFFFNKIEIMQYYQRIIPRSTVYNNEITAANTLLVSSLFGSLICVAVFVYIYGIYRKKSYFNK